MLEHTASAHQRNFTFSGRSAHDDGDFSKILYIYAFHSLLSLFHEFARNLSDVSCTHDENNVAFFDVVINEFHNFIRIARKQRFDFSG